MLATLEHILVEPGCVYFKADKWRVNNIHSWPDGKDVILSKSNKLGIFIAFSTTINFTSGSDNSNLDLQIYVLCRTSK